LGGDDPAKARPSCALMVIGFALLDSGPVFQAVRTGLGAVFWSRMEEVVITASIACREFLF